MAHFRITDELFEDGPAADAGRCLFHFAMCHAVKIP
jgi:hypothetical protein